MEKYGITKAELGITSHGLRKERLNQVYKEVSGVNSAIQGGEEPESDIFKEAKLRVSEYAGHARMSISNAYIGSHAIEKQKRHAQITDEQIQVALLNADGNKTHAAEALGVGRAYLYKRIANFD